MVTFLVFAAIGIGIYLLISEGSSVLAGGLILGPIFYLILASFWNRRSARRYFQLGWDARLRGATVDDHIESLVGFDALEVTAFNLGHTQAGYEDNPDSAFDYTEIKSMAKEAFSRGIGR